MSDDPVKECEVCGEPVRRLLFPVAVHFKGNGFYSTDYARKNALGTAGTNAPNGGGDTPSGDSSSSTGEKASGDAVKPPASVARTAEPAVASAKND
jgi:predicted nucleic acid-binding Zn ribbon protein